MVVARQIHPMSRHGRLRGPLGSLPAGVALVAFGAALVAAGGWNLLREVRNLGLAWGPLAAAGLNLSLGLAVVAVGVAVRRSDLSPRDRWLVAAGGIGGGLLAGTAQTVTILIRLAEGRSVSEPLFPVLVFLALGSLGGAAVGRQYLRARQAAREASKARDAMAFTNSLLRHDVLNGLQVIEGNADVLTDAGEESVRERAEAIRSRTESLDSLLTEVRSVSQVLTDDVEVQPVDLVGMIESAVDATRKSHQDVTIETDLPDRLLVSGSDALQPVFSNLLTNAVQHGGRDVRVRVSARREGDTAVARVADDGPGIPPEQRERIFQQGVTTDSGGQGLYVADTILRRLGGGIDVEESEWGGAAFVVTLPAADQRT